MKKSNKSIKTYTKQQITSSKTYADFGYILKSYLEDTVLYSKEEIEAIINKFRRE